MIGRSSYVTPVLLLVLQLSVLTFALKESIIDDVEQANATETTFTIMERINSAPMVDTCAVCRCQMSTLNCSNKNANLTSIPVVFPEKMRDDVKEMWVEKLFVIKWSVWHKFHFAKLQKSIICLVIKRFQIAQLRNQLMTSSGRTCSLCNTLRAFSVWLLPNKFEPIREAKWC